MDTRHPQTHCGIQRRCRRRALTLAFFVVLAAPIAWAPHVAAQDAEAPPTLEAKLEQKGKIILRDASLVEWLFAIQREWGVDIVVGNELQRDVVNGAFTDTTLREVLTSILYSRGYGYRKVGKSLLITRLDDMPIKPDPRQAIIPLEFLGPEVEDSVRLLLSQDGKVQSIVSSKSLFVIDSPDVIENIRRFIIELEQHARRSYESEQERLRVARSESADVGGSNSHSTPDSPDGVESMELEEHTRIFPLHYISPEEVAEVIANVLDSARATPLVDDGKIVVTADARGLTGAEELIAQLDVPRKQVRITAYMYDVNVEVMERLGFNWSNSGRGRIAGSGDPNSLLAVDSNSFQGGNGVDTSAMTPAAAAVATATSSAVGSLFTLGHFSRHFDLTSTIQALETTDGSRLLARPNIVAYDLIEASFSSVQEIPVQQLTQTEAGGNIGTTEFREAGITLTVTPRIMEDNSVLLQVTPEFSVLNGFNNGQPIIDRRQATTTLSLLNGQAAVIGGLVRRNEIETDSGVPGILHWKYFGRLFRGHEATVTESELVVFIRAEVIEASFPGDPRDQMTHSTVEHLVNQIPYANPAPVVGSCGDPYCPYHNPRPRSHGDYPGNDKSGFAYQHPHQNHSHQNHPHQNHSSPDYPHQDQSHQDQSHQFDAPAQTHSNAEADYYGTRSEPLQPTPAANAIPARTLSPSRLPSAEQPVPRPPADGERVDDAAENAADDTADEAAEDTAENVWQVVPPVMIDEMARRYRGGRVTMTRLPSVERTEVRQAQQPAPIVVRPNRQAAAPVNQSQASRFRTADGRARMQPLPAVTPQPRTTPRRKNWLENLFQR